MNSKASAKAVKPISPIYNRSEGTLCGFLTQLCAYHYFYAHKLPAESDRVLHSSNCLKKDALDWFKPTLCNYLENIGQPNKMDLNTRAIFQSVDKFKETLKAAFRDPEEEQSAERKIKNLRQCGSASDYVVKFRQIIPALDWDNEPLMAQFYKGLRDKVKDKLVKENRPNDFSKYIAMAVYIDNRLYKCRMEKRGGSSNHHHRHWKNNNNKGGRYQSNTPQSKNQPSTMYRDTRHPGPMELDATQCRPKGKYYNCNKEGHFARDCRQKKRWEKVPERQ